MSRQTDAMRLKEGVSSSGSSNQATFDGCPEMERKGLCGKIRKIAIQLLGAGCFSGEKIY